MGFKEINQAPAKCGIHEHKSETRKQKDVGEELWKTKICHGQWYKATLSQLKTMQKTNWLPQEETSQFEATPKQTRKKPQNHRGGHKQHPPKAKSHTPTPRQTRENAQPWPEAPHQAQAEQADWQSRPINTGPNTQTRDKQNIKKEILTGRLTRHPRRKMT